MVDDVSRLRRMKAVATGLLVGMVLLFLVGFVLQEQYPAFSYLRAAAEGGTVGALADWFAVTAIFKHPMGLKIPHTALIPRKKDALGSKLAEFVQTEFVQGDVAAEKVRNLKITKVAGQKAQEFLADPEHRATTSTQVRGLLIKGLQLTDERAVRDLLLNIVDKHIINQPWSPTLGRSLNGLVDAGHHQQLITMLAERLGTWIGQHPEMIAQVLKERSPSWVPAKVDELLAGKIHRELMSLLADIHRNRYHQVRHDITAWLRDVGHRLEHDPALQDSVETYKVELLNSEQVQAWVSDAWTGLKNAAIAELEDPTSTLALAVESGLDYVAEQCATNEDLQAAVDAQISAVATHALQEYGPALVGVIEQTVQRWDGEQTSRTLELFVGRDLQFIRINGTIVGALAGLTIHSVATLLVSL